MEASQRPIAARRETSPAAALQVVVTAMVFLAVAPAAAQLELGDPVVLHPPLDQRVQIIDGWRYHPGDDPVWADPWLDDSDWAVVDSLIRDPGDMPGGWPGIGWFRRRLTLASAGMPPLVVARAASGAVEEVLIAGPPLGTVARDDFDECQIVMEAGDTVLIMSDGLVEAVSREGEPFSYERTATLLGTPSGRSAADLVDGMFEAVHGHLAGATPQDDITLVALVAR